MESGRYVLGRPWYELERWRYEMETISIGILLGSNLYSVYSYKLLPRQKHKGHHHRPLRGTMATTFRRDGESHLTTTRHHLFSHVVERPQEMRPRRRGGPNAHSWAARAPSTSTRSKRNSATRGLLDSHPSCPQVARGGSRQPDGQGSQQFRLRLCQF